MYWVKNNEISPCSCSNCIEGYYLDNYKCKKNNEECSTYIENTFICESKYSFNGNYYKINESPILKTGFLI